VPRPLRALILEDSPSDLKLVLHELRKAGFDVDYQWVQTEPEFLAGLTPALDAILSDYHMPEFGALRALELLQQRNLDVPFIVVSGAIGEDAAVEIVRLGAADYLLKDRLARLGPAISNAIDKRLAAAALHESEERFRELATNIDEVFWISGVKLETFHYVSPAFERLWSRSAENVDQQPRTLFDWVVEEDRAIVAGAIAEVGDRGQAEAEVRVRHPDGRIRWLWTRTFPILDSSGRVQRIAGLTTDITARKEIERDLARALDAALESSRLKSAFLANMSHEVRTPLNIILASNALIEDALSAKHDAELTDLFNATVSACERLLRTIDAVLDLSKIESGVFDLNMHTIDLTEVVRQQIDETRPLAAKKNLDVALQIENPDIVVSFDDYCLNRAVRNLLDNAIKFADKGSVSVRIYRDAGGRPALDVIDSGIGIDPSYMDQLFQPFSQQDSGYSRRFEGSGLGLALVKRYVELNGAEISVTSDPGKGSTFTVCFAGRK
jgi:PAS domain S-box-containing protein